MYKTTVAKVVVTLYSKVYNSTPDVTFTQILTKVFNEMRIEVKLDKIVILTKMHNAHTLS